MTWQLWVKKKEEITYVSHTLIICSEIHRYTLLHTRNPYKATILSAVTLSERILQHWESWWRSQWSRDLKIFSLYSIESIKPLIFSDPCGLLCCIAHTSLYSTHYTHRLLTARKWLNHPCYLSNMLWFMYTTQSCSFSSSVSGVRF